MNEHTPAIQIQSLTKTFRTGLRRKPTAALQGLDLQVSPGEILGFLGPNGAGKTTTIKILMGLLRPDSGQARLLGREVTNEKARQQVGYLPELPDFYDYLKANEFLFHCGRVSGLQKSPLGRKVPELIERVGLNPDDKRPLRKYSKGMLQRVGIAQSMLSDPQLYILDEPMGGLDPLGRRWVKDLILELGQVGKTVFFSSHVLAEAEAVCNRVALLHRGRLLTQGSMDEVRKMHASTWEVLADGHTVRKDPAIQQLAAHMEPAGTDTLIVPGEKSEPSQLLGQLLQGGYTIRSVNQRQASLEEVFLQALDTENQSEES